MTSDNIFCSQCGVKVANESRYCFKCGSEIQTTTAASLEPYQHERPFELPGPKAFTNLEYSGHGRVWFRNGGFEYLHEIVNDLCDLAYGISSKIDPSDSENQIFDAIPGYHFSRWETDYYPPDGYESVFVEFRDRIPSPFGNLGVKSGDRDFDRSVHVFKGRIEHDPLHTERSAINEQPPRIRKSKLVEEFGIEVKHRFVDRQATTNFSYSLTGHTLSSQGEYSPNYKGLLKLLGLVAVTGSELKNMPEVIKALSGTGGSINFEFFHNEIWQPLHKIWQPCFDVTVKTGWLSSDQRRILLEPSTENRPFPRSDS